MIPMLGGLVYCVECAICCKLEKRIGDAIRISLCMWTLSTTAVNKNNCWVWMDNLSIYFMHMPF